jgi:hypothetical protein
MDNTSLLENSAQSDPSIYKIIGLSLVFGVISLCTIIGNALVIAAIVTEKKLRIASNYLILSLAITDLLVGCWIMPIVAVYDIFVTWKFGEILCKIWHTSVVLCCVASIWHLLAIAISRYLGLTKANQNEMRINYVFIFAAWIIALFVSIAPFFGWQDDKFKERIHIQNRCIVSLNRSYMIFTSTTVFYIPLVLILFSYCILYFKVKRQLQSKFGEEKCERIKTTNFLNVNDNVTEEILSSTYISETVHSSNLPISTNEHSQQKRKKIKKHKRKLSKSLSIITAAFILCWTPYIIFVSTCALLRKEPPRIGVGITSWIGYLNSMCNVIIYSIFVPRFREAFIKLLRKFRVPCF